MHSIEHIAVVDQINSAQEAGDILRNDAIFKEVRTELLEAGVIKPVSEGSFYHGRYAVVPADSGKFEIQPGFRRNHLQDERCLMQAGIIKDVFLASSERVANIHTDGRKKLFHQSPELQARIKWPGLLGSYVTPQVFKIDSTDPFACFIDDEKLRDADNTGVTLDRLFSDTSTDPQLAALIEQYFGQPDVSENDLLFIKVCAALGVVGVMERTSIGSQTYEEPVTRFIDLRTLTAEPITPNDLPLML